LVDGTANAPPERPIRGQEEDAGVDPSLHGRSIDRLPPARADPVRVTIGRS
jgi:hypothetical protein